MQCFSCGRLPIDGSRGQPCRFIFVGRAQSYFSLCLKVYICERSTIIFSSLLEGGSGRSHTRWSADLGRSVSHISTAAQVGSSLKIRSDQMGSSLEIRTFEICDHSINLSFTNRDDMRMCPWKLIKFRPTLYILLNFNSN